MQKLTFSCIFSLLLFCNVSAQNASYLVTNAEVESQSVVKLQIKIFCKEKDVADKEAQCAAIRAVIFDGFPNTILHKPILAEGEKTMRENHSSYFEQLYSERYSDFVLAYRALSKYKKADKDKSTLYEVRVKVLSLRKDLEKNKVRKQFGL